MKLQIFAQLTVVISTLPEETLAGVNRIVRITGGNAEGQLCHFPFKFEEKIFHNCTTDGRDDDRLWCAAEKEYTYGHSQWGFCLEQQKRQQTYGGNANGDLCYFPFEFDGMKYDSCTTDGRPDNFPWCATTAKYTHGDSPFGFCDPVDCQKNRDCAEGYLCNILKKEFINGLCEPCTNDKKCEGHQIVEIVGGNAAGQFCHFPFVYENSVYNSCTSDGRDDGSFWCAADGFFDDKYPYTPWGFCS